MEKIMKVALITIFAILNLSGGNPVDYAEPVDIVEKEVSQIVTIPLIHEEYELHASMDLDYYPVVTDLNNALDEEIIWNELSKHSPNDQITAGIMGYFWKESKFKSNAVAGWDIRNRWKGQDTDICIEFTKDVDEGMEDGSTKEYFTFMTQIKYGGYGLGQWSATKYLEDLYDFVREHLGSIGDARLQCEFTIKSMQENSKLWDSLLECKNAAQCGRRIGATYNGNDEAGAELIASAANIFYGRFHKE